jgi:DHA1 family inner membrane transport protein
LSVIGLAAPMATDLGVPQSNIAFLMTIFAITYAVSAPFLQMIIGDWDRRFLVLLGLGAIAAGMVMSALAGAYEGVAVARVLMALGCAVIGPISSALGANLVPPEKRGMALGIVFAGMTISTVVGVPLTTWLGTQIDWRLVMVLIAIMAGLIALLVLSTVPPGSKGQRTTPRELFTVLTDRVHAPAISVTLVQMAAQFATFALIGLFLNTTTGMAEDLIWTALLVFGLGGVVGNVLSMRLIGRYGFNRLISASLIMSAIIFAAYSIWSPPMEVSMGLIFLWAISGMMMMVPQQARLVSLKPRSQNLILALNASALYVGMAGGSALSGIVSTHYGTAYLPIGSFILTLAALAAFGFSFGGVKKSADRVAAD